jgi:hypothetical protein
VREPFLGNAEAETRREQAFEGHMKRTQTPEEDDADVELQFQDVEEPDLEDDHQFGIQYPWQPEAAYPQNFVYDATTFALISDGQN